MLSRGKRQQTVNHYLELVGLTEFRNYYPHQLSGGMRQRVAIARAFAYPADLLLMDEPFSGLDLQLKLSLIQAFISLWLADRRSVFFVTHDISEALLLGDDILVLTERPARVRQRLQVQVPHDRRHLEDSELERLHKELYNLVTEGNGN